MRKTIDPLVRQVRAFCGKHDMLPQGGTVLCAVSGGRDSMALLHLLGVLGAEEGFQVAAAHFNHRLRPAADRDEAFVRSWCAGRGIPLFCGSGDVSAFAREAGRSVEDAARELRYRFLEEAAEDLGADRIAAAHHREDNAETVLLHLLRGAALQGLGGIPPVRGRIVRPLLETAREDIDQYIRRHSIPFVEDETNSDTAFTRNRLRLEVLPVLEELFPGCGARLAGTAGLLREENGHLQREAEALLPRTGTAVPAALLEAQDRTMGRRLAEALGARLGASLDRRQVEAVLDLGSGGYLDLGGGLYAVRRSGALVLGRKEVPPPPLELREGVQRWGPWSVAVRRGTGAPPERAGAVLRGDLEGALTIATWDGRGRLAVANGSRTIKRLLAGRGVPVDRRGEHPVLLRAGRTVAVLDVAVDWELLPVEGGPWVAVDISREEESG